MSEKPVPPPTLAAVPSQAVPAAPATPVVKDEATANAVETVEEEPYTIKCICNFSDDDGNTIYCETCDTWQHIDCFYPDNREEAIREDFAHSCAECKPRPLNRQKAIERTLRLKKAVLEEESVDKKSKRPPSKSQKKKVKPADSQAAGQSTLSESGRQANVAGDQPSKKVKTSHRPSNSVGSQPLKRSPSYGHSRSNPGHPPSPATTPPDLPDDFQIHHYSAGFCSLYDEHDVPDTHNNAFASLAIPTALSRWLREADTMKQEVGRTHAEVFQTEPPEMDEKRPTLEVKDSTRALNPGTTLRWRSVKSTTSIDKDIPLIELNGEIGFQKDYCADPDNLWADLSSPLPFVFFHPVLPLYIDTRKEGSLARFVRRSCKPNAQLDTYLSGGSEYHFWLVSDRYIPADEQITLPWDFRLEKSVHARWLHLLGLSEDEAAVQDEPALEASEYTAISNWIDRILSEYGGCACDLENNCAFARFHRHYLFGRSQNRSHKKKQRSKARNRTISPTSTSHATNSRAASESHVEDNVDSGNRGDATSLRNKTPTRDRTPLRQGSFDQLGILTEPTDRDKRKVAMVEDSFRRMEQQQPPRKKKRLSGSTPTSATSKPKSRNGSVAPMGAATDSSSLPRSKSGSPALSAGSPNMANPRNVLSGAKEVASISRSLSWQLPSRSRPSYRDAGIQTEPVQDEWFSEPCRLQSGKKRIISLSKRLMSSRLMERAGEEDRRRRCSVDRLSGASAMQLDSPTSEHRPLPKSSPMTEPGSPSLQSPDGTTMNPAQGSAASAAVMNGVKPDPKSLRSPEFRVQIPPVPSFDGTKAMSTPTLSSGPIVQSPVMLSGLPSSFTAPGAYNVGPSPSPVKKKLSLSDYTKSRLNKTAAKVAAGGAALLKPGLTSPEEVRIEVSMEPAVLGKADEAASPSTTAATTANGH